MEKAPSEGRPEARGCLAMMKPTRWCRFENARLRVLDTRSYENVERRTSAGDGGLSMGRALREDSVLCAYMPAPSGGGTAEGGEDDERADARLDPAASPRPL